MEFGGRGGFVEVEVAAEDFVCALARQDHLEALGLDLPGQEVHRHRRPHLCMDRSNDQELTER